MPTNKSIKRKQFNRFKTSKKFKTFQGLLRKAQNNKCWWCGCNISKRLKNASVDHLVELSDGAGDPTSTNNIVLSCIDCNHSRDHSRESFINSLNFTPLSYYNKV